MRRLISIYGPPAVALTATYATFWAIADLQSERLAERYIVAAATVTGTVMGLGIGAAFIWAHKTRLNFAFCLLFMAIAAMFVFVVAPNTIGVVWHGAPIERNTPRNPYALYESPAWLRVWVYLMFNMAMLGVIVEFYRANWEWQGWRPVRRQSEGVHVDGRLA